MSPAPRSAPRTARCSRSLAEGAGAQLFHSNAGKDRAGWVAALLLSIANVPLDVIMQDYLLSNVYLAPSIKAQTETLRAQDGDAVADDPEVPLLDVQENYLQAGFDQVQASYGTMASYLTQGLGVSQTTIDTFAQPACASETRCRGRRA